MAAWLLFPQDGLLSRALCGLEIPASNRSAESAHAPQENRGTSLLEAFTLDEIVAHLGMLRDAAAAGAGAGKGYVLPNFHDENACSACGGTRLTFEPAAIYCSACVQKIKRNQVAASACPLSIRCFPLSRGVV